MTWITPFDASMSADTTWAPLTLTVPPSSVIVMSAPLTVATGIAIAPTRSPAITRPGTTW